MADSSAASALIAAVEAAGVPQEVAAKARFFAAGPGGYAEGDQFLGVRVPVLRRLARTAGRPASLMDVQELLDSRWHEVRLLGGFLLVELYRRADEDGRAAVIDVLLANTERLNNWDLVDSVVPYTLGPWVLAHPRQRDLLDRLIGSPSLWQRRIALMATFALIRAGQFDDLLRLAVKVLDDPHHLIHKACGWMLREVGSRDRAVLNARPSLSSTRTFGRPCAVSSRTIR